MIFEKAWHHVITAEQRFSFRRREQHGRQQPIHRRSQIHSRHEEIQSHISSSGKTIEVDPAKVPYGHNGLPGSILDISEGIKAGLDHACGGVCACSTCHVIVKQGLESCNEATDAELDELDEAPGITPKSRLGCQTVPDGTTDIVVEIPEWNKNHVKEKDH